MAFDQTTRNRLARFVGDARTLLSEEFTRQLQNEFGLDPSTGDVADMATLSRLDDSRRETARLLRETMEHYLATSACDGKRARQDVLERIVREQAFTVLNRLCAIRLAEARGLVIESVAKGYQSKGFQLYARVAGTALGETGDAYRAYLFSLFDELAVDLPVLFDRFSAQGRLFPRETVLLSLLELINHAEIEPLWPEDETIGWIYQYFNSPEERRQMRAASQAPRNSRELAVRNQFFTPRYVVEFLTDNTLGRIWYEMTGGRTSLKDSGRYLVRRPDEIFLSALTVANVDSPSEGCVRMAKLLQEGSEADWPPFDNSSESTQPMIDLAHCVNGYDRHPDFGDWLAEFKHRVLIPMQYEGASTQDVLDAMFFECRADRHGGDGSVYREGWFVAGANEVRRRALRSRQADLSQEELLKQPVFVPFRARKDPREIRMLDPACGSMHFGLYAFDLFERIYEEAWELEADDCAAQFVRPEGLAPLRETYCDKYGFLREVPRLIIERNIHGIDIDPRAVQIAGLSLWLRAHRSWKDVKPLDRPQIRRSNIVCAEPMPGDRDVFEDFLESLQEDHLESLIRRVLDIPQGKQVRATAEMADSLCDLVRIVWKEMELAGEAGSLLKIEEALANAIDASRAEWEGKQPLFRITEFGLDAESLQTRYLKIVPGAMNDFWTRAEALVLAALGDYAEQADNGAGYQRRLFVDDAAHGFAFIDICRKRYDVALMNPPFGDASQPSLRLLDHVLAQSGRDVGAAFIFDALQRLVPEGIVGSVISTAPWFKPAFSEWRRTVFCGADQHLFAGAHLGGQVLDGATVAGSAIVVAHGERKRSIVVRAIAASDDSENAQLILTTLAAASFGQLIPGRGFYVDPLAACALFGSPFAYWVSDALRSRIAMLPSLEEAGATVKQGTATADELRFGRAWWEVPTSSALWVSYTKSSEYQPLLGRHFVGGKVWRQNA